MSYLDFLNSTYPVRNLAEEKSAFCDWATAEAEKRGYPARVEQNEKHDNVVIGNPDKAQVIFTAHYDTPRRSLTPNLMLPANKALYWVYNISISLILVAIALIASKSILALSGYEMSDRRGWLIWYVSYIVLFVGLFKLVLFGPRNRHNFNDNTSGTAAVMELVSRLAGDGKAAFILFDDEEKGKKGSKAYAKAHPEIKEAKLIVNMDCVANGEHFIICATREAQAQADYGLFAQAWQDADGFEAKLYDAGKIAMNSDQKSFNCGVGVCACHRYRYIGYCTPRIHTKYDTVASNNNIVYLTDTLERFVKQLG